MNTHKETITQWLVFLENKVGELAHLCELLGNAGVNIRGLSVSETRHFGVFRLVVDNQQKAQEAFNKAELMARSTEVIAVKVEDKPGGLARVLRLLADEGLDINYAYGLIERLGKYAVVMLQLQEIGHALSILKNNNITIIREEELR